MAVAETAELAVKLSLNDKQFGDAINRIDRRLGAFSGAVNRNLARAIDYGAARAARALVGAFRGGIDELRALEVATAQTEAVIKSTGGTAGVTADQVRNLAEKYEDLNAIIDDKAIQSAENLLLTFTNIREDAFEPTLQASLDMATALGTDVASAAKTLGRALQDPERGMTRLERSIGPLDDALKEQIKTLTEQGDLLGAQRLLLDEVAKRYGGSFARQGQTAEASQARLADKVDEVQKAFAQRLLPVVVKVSDKISDYLARPETIAFFDKLGETIAGLFTDENLDTAAQAIETAASVVTTAIQAFNALPPEIKALAIGALTLNKVTGGAVGGAAEAFGKLIGAGIQKIFAAHVTVVGKSVAGVGGGSGVPGAGGGGGALGTAVGVAGAATGGVVAAQISKDLGEELAKAVANGNDEVEARINKLLDLNRTMTFGPIEHLRALPEYIDRIVNGAQAGTNATRNVGRIVRGEGRATIGEHRRSTAKLQASEQRSLVAFRAGERATERVAGKLNVANSRLGTIARKDLSVKVNVSNPVTVATYVRGVAVSTRYGGNFSVTAT